MPRRGPYLYDWFTNVYELTISFRLSPISPNDAQGRLLGYTVTYIAMDQLNYNNSRTMVVSPNTTRITLRNLKGGSTYTIATAGFTRKGRGTYRIFSATCKCRCYFIESVVPCSINLAIRSTGSWLYGEFVIYPWRVTQLMQIYMKHIFELLACGRLNRRIRFSHLFKQFKHAAGKIIFLIV